MNSSRDHGQPDERQPKTDRGLCVKEPVAVGVRHTEKSVDDGGLMSYGADFVDLYRRAAVLRG